MADQCGTGRAKSAGLDQRSEVIWVVARSVLVIADGGTVPFDRWRGSGAGGAAARRGVVEWSETARGGRQRDARVARRGGARRVVGVSYRRRSSSGRPADPESRSTCCGRPSAPADRQAPPLRRHRPDAGCLSERTAARAPRHARPPRRPRYRSTDLRCVGCGTARPCPGDQSAATSAMAVHPHRRHLFGAWSSGPG